MPTHDDFQLSDADKALILSLTNAAGKLDWKAADFDPIRRRIRNLHLEIQGNSCCYCRKSMHEAHGLEIDVEHVLPQGIFFGLALDTFNLSVACKRCNMGIKREKWHFVNGLTEAQVINARTASATYQLIHPNLDRFAEHLSHVSVDVDGFRFRKFKPKSASDKGKFTYEFMRLDEVEVGDLDYLQGLHLEQPKILALIDVLRGLDEPT
jgi:hypothetical protein